VFDTSDEEEEEEEVEADGEDSSSTSGTEDADITTGGCGQSRNHFRRWNACLSGLSGLLMRLAFY